MVKGGIAASFDRCTSWCAPSCNHPSHHPADRRLEVPARHMSRPLRCQAREYLTRIRQRSLAGRFGIATTLIGKRPRITPYSGRKVLGTPEYLAPEQVSGDPLLASDQCMLAARVHQWLRSCPSLKEPLRRSVITTSAAGEHHLDPTGGPHRKSSTDVRCSHPIGPALDRIGPAQLFYFYIYSAP
jgi:hypothetical protein